MTTRLQIRQERQMRGPHGQVPLGPTPRITPSLGPGGNGAAGETEAESDSSVGVTVVTSVKVPTATPPSSLLSTFALHGTRPPHSPLFALPYANLKMSGPAQSAAANVAASRLQKFMNHPAGPKCVYATPPPHAHVLVVDDVQSSSESSEQNADASVLVSPSIRCCDPPGVPTPPCFGATR